MTACMKKIGSPISRQAHSLYRVSHRDVAGHCTADHLLEKRHLSELSWEPDTVESCGCIPAERGRRRGAGVLRILVGVL